MMSDADDSEDDGVPSVIISDRATLSDLSVGDTETKTSNVNRVVSNKVSRITKCLNNLDISSQIDFSMTNKDTTVSCINSRTWKVEEIVAPENVAGNSTEVVNNFESIIRSTKNNELIQEKERKKRAANLIIYGINKEFDEQRDLKEHDNNFINSFLDVIGISLRPNQIIRLGKVSETRKRPVKIVLNNLADKDSIMA